VIGIIFPRSAGDFAGGIDLFFAEGRVEEPFETATILAAEDGGGLVHPVEVEEGESGGVELGGPLVEGCALAMRAGERFAVDDDAGHGVCELMWREKAWTGSR